MVKIDHGIEIPKAGRPKSMGTEYNLHEMKVGDSILIEDAAVARRVLTCTVNRRELGEAFTRRVVDGGTRFWRTK